MNNQVDLLQKEINQQKELYFSLEAKGFDSSNQEQSLIKKINELEQEKSYIIQEAQKELDNRSNYHEEEK